MATETTTAPAAEPKAYKLPDEVFFNDGREEQLLEFVQKNPNLPCDCKRNPKAILDIIDDFGHKHAYLMNVGWRKGKIVTDLIAEHKPEVMVELGAYIGYSTILFADAVKRAGGKKYVSFERDPKFARISKSLVELAGLGDFVHFVVGSSSRNIVVEHENERLTKVDFFFLDHHKPSYVRDLKILESLGIIRKGVVLTADNVIHPGNPPYLKYVRSSVEEKQEALAAAMRVKSNNDEGFRDHTTNQYKYHSADREVEDNTEATGDPTLVYKSELIESQEPNGVPDGIEVTICVGP